MSAIASEFKSIERLAAVSARDLDGLAALLIDCVGGGASVSFMHPLSVQKAHGFWLEVARDVALGKRLLMVARDLGPGADPGAIVGTVHLVLEQPENQPHRADVSKMLVHPRARRRGLGEALLRAAERAAKDCGKSLLMLDTASADAERLYARLGWRRVGVVPGFALLPQGGLCDTTFFYREL